VVVEHAVPVPVATATATDTAVAAVAVEIDAAKAVHPARIHSRIVVHVHVRIVRIDAAPIAHIAHAVGGAAPSRVRRVQLPELRRAVPGRRRQEVTVLFRTGLGKDPGIVADQYEAVDIKGVEGFGRQFGGGIIIIIIVVIIAIAVIIVVAVAVQVLLLIILVRSIIVEIQDALGRFGNNVHICCSCIG